MNRQRDVEFNNRLKKKEIKNIIFHDKRYISKEQLF